ncbi:unnamed protein product [Rhodiola kirilowii]
MILSLTALVFFIFILARTRSRLKYKRSSASTLPPGPQKFPLIGNMHLFAAQQQSTHRFLKDLAAKYGPIMHLKLGEVSTFVITSADLAKQVLKDHDLAFAQRPQTLATKIMFYGSTDIIFSEYGDYWRQLRKICILELLSSKRVQSYRSIREEGVSGLLRMILHNSSSCDAQVNISQLIISSNYAITAKAAFGKKCKYQDAFIACIKEMVKLLGGFFISDMYPSLEVLSVFTGMKRKVQNQHRIIDRILEDIIKEHREATPSNDDTEVDLVDVLLRIQRNHNLPFPLTDDNLKAVILDVFSAGSETSSTAVEWAMSELIRSPRILKKAQEEVRQIFDEKEYVDEAGLHELKYLKLIIKETLRLHPSAPLLVPREAREACEIGGYLIPSKSKVIINAWAIAQSSQYWDEGERFYPERFENNPVDYKGTDFPFIPFGAGRRMCPGIAFAIANIELPLAQLLYHFNWEVPSGKSEDLDMSEEFGITVRRKNDLYLIPRPYSSLK